LTTLLKVANTKSNDQYTLFSKEKNVKVHPARMPEEIANFFIRFLAGSNTTGSAAEKLRRKWLSMEQDWSYVGGSIGPFHHRERSPEICEIGDSACNKGDQRYPPTRKSIK
jgi:DNA modification methylase